MTFVQDFMTGEESPCEMSVLFNVPPKLLRQVFFCRLEKWDLQMLKPGAQGQVKEWGRGRTQATQHAKPMPQPSWPPGFSPG